MTKASDLIAAERDRQIQEEGHKPDGDKGREMELLRAADCYMDYWVAREQYPYMAPELFSHPADIMINHDVPAWPWAREAWKPSTFERDLAKAGALIAAALDAHLEATNKETNNV